MAHLYKDPVSQICFGLTSSYFYWQVFHEVRDEKNYAGGGKLYCYPLDLRFQVSACGQYSVYGWWEYGFLLDDWDVEWHRSLGERLCEERWLWGSLRYCEGCISYKPESAFEWFEAQQALLQSVSNREVEVDSAWLENICKRCRAKQLFRYLGDREEVREQRGNPWEERKSLGLKRLTAGQESFGEDEHASTYSRWTDECEVLNGTYEPWESVFMKLGI